MSNGFETRTFDFRVKDCGSICILTAESIPARDWANEHLEGAQRWGGGWVVEDNYIDSVLNGIVGDGLTFTT